MINNYGEQQLLNIKHLKDSPLISKPGTPGNTKRESNRLLPRPDHKQICNLIELTNSNPTGYKYIGSMVINSILYIT